MSSRVSLAQETSQREAAPAQDDEQETLGAPLLPNTAGPNVAKDAELFQATADTANEEPESMEPQDAEQQTEDPAESKLCKYHTHFANCMPLHLVY